MEDKHFERHEHQKNEHQREMGHHVEDERLHENNEHIFRGRHNEKVQKENNGKIYLLLVLVSLLLVFSVVQAMEVNSLEENFVTGNVASQGVIASPSKAGSPSPSSAPTMVGGC